MHGLKKSGGSWSGQTSLTPPISTPSAPAAATFQDMIYIIYRKNDTEEVGGFTFDGTTTRNPVDSPYDPKSSTGVGLAVYGKRLYVAHLGKDSPTIWCSSFDGTNWSQQTKVTDLNRCESTKTPALCAYGGKLYMVYRGKDSDTLWYCTFDGTSWSSQYNITDVNGAQSTDAPALAEYDGKLYMVYRGKSGSNNIWCCYHDGQGWFGQTEITNEGRRTSSPQTSERVGLAVFDKKLYMVYRGKDTSNMWSYSFDGSKWDRDETSITEQNSAKTSEAPALAVLGKNLYTIYRGEGSDQVYSCYLPPS